MKHEAKNSVPLFIVEGNIGAGKSTFLRILSRYLRVQTVFEPSEQWQNVDGENILEKFYEDPHRWAYTFQTYAFISRVRTQEAYQAINDKPAQVLERSVYSDRFCFAKNCYELGYINSLEWKMYKKLFSWLVDEYVQKPTAFVYLRTDPKVCYERLRKRNRSEESEVPLSYIEMLHKRHEEWLIEHKDDEVCIQGIPVLVLDNNQDFENSVDVQKEHIKKLVQFIKEGCGCSAKEVMLPGITL